MNLEGRDKMSEIILIKELPEDYQEVVKLGKLRRKEGSPTLRLGDSANVPLASLALLLVVSKCKIENLPNGLAQVVTGLDEPYVIKPGGYHIKRGLLLEIHNDTIRKIPSNEDARSKDFYWVVPKETFLRIALSLITSTARVGAGKQYLCLTHPLTKKSNFLCLNNGKVISVTLIPD